MTPTPRTDANESITCKEGDPCIAPDFARQLERENAELADIGAMTQEQKRVAIAQACGWQKCVGDSGLVTRYEGTPSETTVRVTLPNYLNDLNAMHEAEKVLGLKYDQWTRELRGVCERERRCVESATAAQRAEAFGLTLNLWK